MPLLSGDIRFARSANMTDVSYGGGPPSSQLLTSGRSNEIMPDISEETRTVGRVEIYQIHGVLRGETHRVIFDQAKGGFSAQPIWKLLDGEITPELFYRPTFRFLKV